MISKKKLRSKPFVKIPNHFEEQLLESMKAKGLRGQELLDSFEQAKSNIGWTLFRRDTDK